MGFSRYFVLYHMRTAAFVLVGAAAFFGVWRLNTDTTARLREQQNASSEKIIAAQIAACERGNTVRRALNEDTKIIRYFMQEISVATARRPGKAAAARSVMYSQFAKSLVDVPVPDCEHVIEQR